MNTAVATMTGGSAQMLPKIKPRLFMEVVVLSSLVGAVSTMVGKMVDKNYPVPDKKKSMMHSLAETFVQLGLTGGLLYLLKETMMWGTKKVYSTQNDPFVLVTPIIAICLLNAQKNLQARLLTL
tara:strand:- start:7608 stop:7979 length:372 start_codon:yes stop_codon:yes gene_type:complete